jgi:phosphopantothenoylcysteine decarboxylase/phosphopantothenate--cysteine ligase
VEEFAEAKRLAKGVDLIAANQVASETGGFERDENALTLCWQTGKERLPLMDKTSLARRLAERITTQYHADKGRGAEGKSS